MRILRSTYNWIFVSAGLSFFTISSAQQYKDYIGAGHNIGISVTSSSNTAGNANKILDGSGMEAPFFDASRFAAQATFGVNPADIDVIKNMGYEPWINDQFTKTPSLITPTMGTIWNQIVALDPDTFGPYGLHFNYAWWQTNMTNQDLLRQRVAYALSQILVTSGQSELDGHGTAMSSYYDIFINQAFGNYKDILLAVTKHPSMGYFLSHFNNPKEDIPNNIHPDENYAREIMQLFSIGLFQLNMNGSKTLNANNQPIPTYTNDDIRGLARVFTGLGGGAPAGGMYCNFPVEFGTDWYCVSKTVPMAMFGWAHQPGSKTFLGYTITGQTTYTNSQAMAEVDNAVNFLFNHANTAPFVSHKLIQRFTTSNPSSAYIGRVAAIFANNGQGIRGDMKAVIKAILLDPEARNVASFNLENNGKIREPFLRYTQLCRSLPVLSDRGRFWNHGYSFSNEMKQHVMYAPSVFNFYLPDFQPVGDLDMLNLVSPELKLHNTSTSINYFNFLYDCTEVWGNLMYSWEGTNGNPDRAYLDYTYLISIADDSETLINYLDKIFTHGQLTSNTKNLIRAALNPYYYTWNTDWKKTRASTAIYLIMSSPDYVYAK